MAAPIAFARVSNSMPIPSQSTVCSWRYQAKPSTPTCVILPPKQPLRSIKAVRAPARAAASAAARPPGPLPTTSTSVSRITSTVRAASLIFFITADHRSMDVRLQRIYRRSTYLFNTALVITLQRSVRKKRSAAQNAPRRDRRRFPYVAEDCFGLLDRHKKSVFIISFVIVFTKPLGDCFAEQPETRLRYRGGAQHLCRTVPCSHRSRHLGYRGNHRDRTAARGKSAGRADHDSSHHRCTTEPAQHHELRRHHQIPSQCHVRHQWPRHGRYLHSWLERRIRRRPIDGDIRSVSERRVVS